MPKATRLEEAYKILKGYNGTNPFILNLKHLVYTERRAGVIKEFQIDYILRNCNIEPRAINKIVKLADWYGEKKQSEWHTEFIPQVIKIISFLGETEFAYHCYVQYRTSVSPTLEFISKRGIVGDFLYEDYHGLKIDFDRYDRLSMSIDSNRKLFPHQKEAVQFLLSRKKCILADDQGLGKTTSLSVAAIEGNFDSIVIICPASLKTNWAKELQWYVPSDDISMLESFINKTKPELEEFLGYPVGKSNKKRDELLTEAKDKGKWESNRFVILNYDILEEFYKIPSSRSRANISKSFEESPLLRYIHNRKSLIIIDEAHKLSNNTSNRYKIISDLIKRGEPHSIYLTTGTPVTNNPQNLFCLLKLIGDPVADDWNYYMNRYCGAKEIVSPKDKEKRNRISDNFVRAKGKANWFGLTNEEKEELHMLIKRSCRMMTIAQDATNLDELKDKISHIYLRRLKDDVGNLPPKIVHEVTYDLTESQRVEYERLWDEYEIAKKTENPDAELNKELLEGGIYRRYLALEMVDKTVALANKLLSNEPDCKIVIFCCFDNELYALKEIFGDKCVVHNGKLNQKQKDKAVYEFQNNEDVKILLGNVISSGVGLTLTRGNKIIFNDFDFVPGNSHQCEDRIHRLGQTKQCDIYYQFFSDTQYEYMWNIVLKKSYNIDQIIKKEEEK